MRTRKIQTVNSSTTPKKTSPAVKESAGISTETSPTEISEPKRASSGRTRKLKVEDGSPSIIPSSKPQSSVEMATPSPEATKLTKVSKPVPKVVRKVVKKVIKKKIPVSSRDTSGRFAEISADEKVMIEEKLKEKALEGSNIVESVGHEPTTDDSTSVYGVQGSVVKDKEIIYTGKLLNKDDMLGEQQKHLMQSTANLCDVVPNVTGTMSMDGQDPTLSEAEDLEEDEEEQTVTNNETLGKQDNASLEEAGTMSMDGQDPTLSEAEYPEEDEEELTETNNESLGKQDNTSLLEAGTMSMDGPDPTLAEAEDPEEDEEEQTETNNESLGKQDNASLEEAGDEKIEGISDQEVHEEFGGEDFADDDEPENVAEAETLEEEQVELNVAAKERRARKEKEIFVGGLDRDAVEEDIRKVFKYAGEVVEIRIHKDPATNKNKGFAFVQFATKEQASYALSEMKNPVIHGTRCGTASIEGDDTLFLGNICNTWTKDAINQKLKDYGVEGVENITMVADPRNEGLSRGFVFVEFSCHAEALLAYKRLQKPDVVFGHSERTAKVAFAEPQREPDPEVMAQVKSVFVDGLPQHWDEDRVRENFKVFGEITKILLARNMSTAKRKDFGFVDFNTHQDAVSCVEGVNKNGLNDGNSKVTVRARLSNPLPKMQAIKGGMCGGFRIGHGRGFAQGGQHLNRSNIRDGRVFYPRGAGRGGRVGSSSEHGFNVPQRPFYGRHNSGQGERWGFRDGYQGPEPARPFPSRLRYGDGGYGHYESYRGPTYSFEEGYARPFIGRHFDDSYPYDDVAYGIKRPYYMMDQDSDFAEPSRSRPRLEQSDPLPNRRTRYQDDFGADGSFLPQNYYGSGYGGGAYPAFNRADHPYGRDYYY